MMGQETEDQEQVMLVGTGFLGRFKKNSSISWVSLSICEKKAKVV